MIPGPPMPPLPGPPMRPYRPHHPHHPPHGNSGIRANSYSKRQHEPSGPPVTVFVGNITERAPDAMIRHILAACGHVVSWKRVQGNYAQSHVLLVENGDVRMSRWQNTTFIPGYSAC